MRHVLLLEFQLPLQEELLLLQHDVIGSLIVIAHQGLGLHHAGRALVLVELDHLVLGGGFLFGFLGPHLAHAAAVVAGGEAL